jgi:DNA (cytosine-5)-methyltransferase 1
MIAHSNFLFNEIIVDNFAGGGGASTGIELATGRNVDIAINHDEQAIAMHTVNHPNTQHYCESVWDIVPRNVVNGRPVALVWLSPDCKHFSKAKGSKPVEKSIRGLAWVAIRWAATVKPRVIMLENVEEFKTWGPLNDDGKPCKKRQGQTFESFKQALKLNGYTVEHRELRACDYGAPTIRKRLFLIARRDGMPIVWPKPTHGKPDSKEVKKGKLLTYKTAAECIDFSRPCPSIFERKRPLVANTLKRIAKGMRKFVLDTDEPFIISYYGPKKDGEFRGSSLSEPLPTQTTENRFGLVTPYISEFANASSQRNMSANEPLRTICAQVKGGHFGLITGHIAKHFTGATGSSLRDPLSTVTSIDHNALVTSHLIQLRNGQYGRSLKEPIPTLTAGGGHVGEIRGCLVKYYGTGEGQELNEPLHTITTKDRFGLATIKAIKLPLSDDELYQAWWCARFMEEYEQTDTIKSQIPAPRPQWINVGKHAILVDIGMRMLQPRELYNAQGFPSDYIIDHDADGNKITKTSQVARCGNAVPPPFTEHLVKANLPELCVGGDYYEATSPRAVGAN